MAASNRDWLMTEKMDLRYFLNDLYSIVRFKFIAFCVRQYHPLCDHAKQQLPRLLCRHPARRGRRAPRALPLHALQGLPD